MRNQLSIRVSRVTMSRRRFWHPQPDVITVVCRTSRDTRANCSLGQYIGPTKRRLFFGYGQCVTHGQRNSPSSERPL
jgi:hypothetical protein